MQFFTLTHLNQKVGEVIDAANQGPVTLTKHGRPAYVIMPAAAYDRLARSQSWQVFPTHETPDHVADIFLPALEAFNSDKT